jgi:hypothetical protein
VLRSWWTGGALRLAVAIRAEEYGDVLITHAGLTRGRWCGSARQVMHSRLLG